MNIFQHLLYVRPCGECFSAFNPYSGTYHQPHFPGEETEVINLRAEVSTAVDTVPTGTLYPGPDTTT